MPKLTLEIKSGNIFDIKAHAIVIPANRNPKYAKERNLDYQIYHKANVDKLLSERMKASPYGKLDAGDVVVTSGCESQYAFIIHVVVPRNTVTPEKKIKACYKDALEAAYNVGVESVVIPLLGTGSMKYNRQMSFNAALSAIMEFSSEKRFLILKEMKVTLNTNKNDVEILKSGFDNEYRQKHYVPEVNSEPADEARWFLYNRNPYQNDASLAKEINKDQSIISKFCSKKTKSIDMISAVSIACAMNLEADDFDRFVSLSTGKANYIYDKNVSIYMKDIMNAWGIREETRRNSEYKLILERIIDDKVNKKEELRLKSSENKKSSRNKEMDI